MANIFAKLGAVAYKVASIKMPGTFCSLPCLELSLAHS
jgi:hypothetical protein